jgi:hypothetical protein
MERIKKINMWFTSKYISKYIIGLFLFTLGIIEIIYCITYFSNNCTDILVFLTIAFVINIKMSLIIFGLADNLDIGNKLYYLYNLFHFIMSIWALIIYFEEYNCQYIIPHLWPLVLIHFAIFWCYICGILILVFNYCYMRIRSRTSIINEFITNEIIDPVTIPTDTDILAVPIMDITVTKINQ